MNAMIDISNDHLGKHDCPLCMHSAICDPVFLSQGCGRPDDKLISVRIKGGCGLHLHSIIP